MSRAQVDMLTVDIEAACQTLDQKGRITGSKRDQVKQGSGY
jgi:hypothetical protein